ncbi:MAG: glycosyltransferase family 9 protein, partial [Phormidesmis sp.]
LLTHYLPESEPQQFIRHEVQRQLDLVASIGCKTVDQRLRICVLPEAKTAIARQLLHLGLGSRQDWPHNWPQDWIVIHAGASAPSRRYPLEHFSRVAQSLFEKGITPVFTGILSERSLVDAICRQMNTPAISLVGKLTLPEMTALLAAAPLLLSNNTGPVHLAAAVGTPVVDLYALTNVQHTPWQVPSRVLSHEVPCRLCYKSICPEGHHHCLRLVPPESVVAAVLDLLNSEPLKDALPVDTAAIASL